MKQKYVPLICSLLLICESVGLQVYALNSTASLSTTALVFLQVAILVLVLAFAVIGIVASWRTAPKTVASIVYTLGCLLVAGGYISFYALMNVPTAINVGGLLAIVVGLIFTTAGGIILTVRDDQLNR